MGIFIYKPEKLTWICNVAKVLGERINTFIRNFLGLDL